MSNFQDPPITCPSTSEIFHPSPLSLTWTFNFKRAPPLPIALSSGLWGWLLLAPGPVGGFLFRWCASVWLGVVFGHGAFPIFFYKAGYRLGQSRALAIPRPRPRLPLGVGVISSNRASFHLWWKENFVKHQKVSKY